MKSEQVKYVVEISEISSIRITLKEYIYIL